MLDEGTKRLQVQLKALDSLVYLPDYLMDEAMSETGQTHSEDMAEFKPAILYMEQILRLYPKELSVKFKMTPAWEESLMRMEEENNEDAN